MLHFEIYFCFRIFLFKIMKNYVITYNIVVETNITLICNLLFIVLLRLNGKKSQVIGGYFSNVTNHFKTISFYFYLHYLTFFSSSHL